MRSCPTRIEHATVTHNQPSAECKKVVLSEGRVAIVSKWVSGIDLEIDRGKVRKRTLLTGGPTGWMRMRYFIHFGLQSEVKKSTRQGHNRAVAI